MATGTWEFITQCLQFSRLITLVFTLIFFPLSFFYLARWLKAVKSLEDEIEIMWTGKDMAKAKDPATIYLFLFKSEEDVQSAYLTFVHFLAGVTCLLQVLPLIGYQLKLSVMIWIYVITYEIIVASFLLVLILFTASLGLSIRENSIQYLNSYYQDLTDSWNADDGGRSLRIHMLQWSLGCCGVNSANDFIELERPIPSSCCSGSINSTCHPKDVRIEGCMDKLASILLSEIAFHCPAICLLLILDLTLMLISATYLRKKVLQDGETEE